MTYLSGIAYRKDEQEMLDKRMERFRELRELGKINITKRRSEFNRMQYEGTCEDVSEEDVIIFCDYGCVPFGGGAEIIGNEFRCYICTD